jgi:hypothetical protein
VFLKSVCSDTINFAVIPEKTMISLLTAWFVAVCYGMEKSPAKKKEVRTTSLKRNPSAL